MPIDKSAVKSTRNTNTVVANIIEDTFKILLKLLDEKEKYLSDKRFLQAMKEQEQPPVFLSMENTAATRLIRELDKIGVPYMHFQVVGTSKDILLIRPDDKRRVQDIENGIRIHAGLEIDTKDELDRALYISEPNAKECVISGLTEYEAVRVCNMAKNSKSPFTAVMEQMEDGTFLIACHEKHKQRIEQMLVEAILEESSHSKTMQKIVEANVFLHQHRQAFLGAVEEVRENNWTRDAYLVSLSDPQKYIHIHSTGFDIVDRGLVTHSMSIEQDPLMYADALKLMGSSIPNALYVLSEEAQAAGGLANCISTAREKAGSGITPTPYPIDTEFKKWVGNMANVRSGKTFLQSATLSAFATADEFKKTLMRDAKLMDSCDEIKMVDLNHQLEGLRQRMGSIESVVQSPVLDFVDIAAAVGYDTALHEDFYDKEEVRAIMGSKYIEDQTHESGQTSSDRTTAQISQDERVQQPSRTERSREEIKKLREAQLKGTHLERDENTTIL